MLRYVLPVMLALVLVVGCGNDNKGKKGKGTESAPGTVSAPAAQGEMSKPAAAALTPQDEIKARVAELIAVLESGGDGEKAMQEFMPPEEFEAFKKEPGFKDEVAAFKEKKAGRLLTMLKGLDFGKLEVTGDHAQIPTGTRPIEFKKIDGKWYIAN